MFLIININFEQDLRCFFNHSNYLFIKWVECSLNVRGDQGSIPGRVIPKTFKLLLVPPCLKLSNIRYVSRVKWCNPGE